MESVLYETVKDECSSSESENSEMDVEIYQYDEYDDYGDEFIYPPRSFTSICFLRPSLYNWTIKAKVVSKSDKRSWSNQRGEGKLFVMNLADSSGAIRATAFNDACDYFYDLIEVNKVYHISDAFIRRANKNFSNLEHNFELDFKCGNTSVKPCLEDINNPRIKYNFCPINEVSNLNADSLIDLIGICQSVGESQYPLSRTTRARLTNREIVLVDETKASVSVVLWGTIAEEFDGTLNPVVAIKGAKVSEYNGSKNIQVTPESFVKLNPDILQAKQLSKWFSSLTEFNEFANISHKLIIDEEDCLWTLKEIYEGMEKFSNRYYNVEATILFVDADTAIYKSCANKGCHKKVIESGNNMYWCEKCDGEFDSFEYRFKLVVQIGDWTETENVILFGTIAEAFLGVKANEIVQGNSETCFQKPIFKKYVFRVETTMDHYGDTKLIVKNFQMVDFKESSEKLISELKSAQNLSMASHMEKLFYIC